MKTYVITLSRHFLANHKRAGEETHFKEKLLSGEKLHTIRANYPLWEKRIKEVQEGRAVILKKTHTKGRTIARLGDHICQYESGLWQVYGSEAADKIIKGGKYAHE